MPQLGVLPRQTSIISGVVAPSAVLRFYQTGTSTPQNAYTDAALTAPVTSLTADSAGLFAAWYLNPDAAADYRYTIETAAGAVYYTQDAISKVAFTQADLGLTLYPRTAAEIFAGITPTNYAYPPGHAFRHGADPTGAVDATTALQNWIDAAWAMYNYSDGQGIWGGGGGAIPVLTLPPGKFKITGTLYLPNGITLRGTGRPANTVSHTRIIMDSTATSAPDGAGDNRNKPMFKFERGSTRGGGVLVNQFLVATLQDMELGYVTPSSTFSNPYSGSGIPFGDYPAGGCVAIDIDTVDMRFVGMSFHAAPCHIRVLDVPASSTTRADGFTGNTGAYFYMEDCESDAAASHIHATNAYVDARMSNCKFYGGRHQYGDATGAAAGRIVYEVCQWFGDSFIDADYASNTFKIFRLAGGQFDQHATLTSISVANAKILDILDVTFDIAAAGSTIAAFDCDGGKIANNTISNSGYNAGAGTGLSDFVAAIKMLGCRNMMVALNHIQATEAATYGGFGILAGDSGGRTSLGNYVALNKVSTAHDGAAYAGVGRFINVTALDRLGPNDIHPTGTVGQRIGVYAKKTHTLTYSASIAIDASLANSFDIVVSDTVAFTISNPTNGMVGQEIAISIKNASGGTIGNVTWGSGATYKIVAAGFTKPADGAHRTVKFRFDGTSWFEQRPDADVTN